MSIVNLSKGQVIDLGKISTSNKYELRASWDVSSITPVDIDIMALLCDGARKAIQPMDKNFVFYNNLKSIDGSVEHTGDNRDGSGDGWDEIIKIDFSKMQGTVENVQLILNIHEGIQRGINFGITKNLEVQVFDIENNMPVASYIPELENSTDTCLVIGEFFKKNGNFYYKAIGNGTVKGLEVVLGDYGVQATY